MSSLRGSADFSMDNTSYVNTPTQMHLPYPEVMHIHRHITIVPHMVLRLFLHTQSIVFVKVTENPMVNGSDVKVPTKTTLFYLYRSLNQGQTVKEWYMQHKKYWEMLTLDVLSIWSFTGNNLQSVHLSFTQFIYWSNRTKRY